MIGRWHGLVIDCPEPAELAEFYQELLGMQRVQDEGDWVVIGDAPDRPGVAFQRVANLRPPQWPNPDHPQQLHVDVRVSDLEGGTGAGRAATLRRGSELPGVQRPGRASVLPRLVLTPGTAVDARPRRGMQRLIAGSAHLWQRLRHERQLTI